MNWNEVCNDPLLKDLPYKIELNRWGKIEMSPAKSRHSVLQGEIQRLIVQLVKEGRIFPECPIQTEDNVKVADVVWISEKRYQQVKEEDVYSIAPETCIEVKSTSNTIEEMLHKKNLYLKAGAKEFWLCDEKGKMSFYTEEGEISSSNYFTQFPHKIEI